MTRRRWTDEEVAVLRSMAEGGRKDAEIGHALGRSEKSVELKRRAIGLKGGQLVRNRTAKAEPEVKRGDQVVFDEGGESATLDSRRSSRIRTLDDLLASAPVDLTEWEVERHIVNKWEVGAKGPDGKLKVEELWQVKAWFKRIRGAVDLAELRDRVVADMRAHAPAYPALPAPSRFASYMLEVDLPDLHVGKLAWGEEVDDVNYDSHEARRVALEAVEDLLQKASAFPVERILFPVGNDLLHADTPEGTTTRGTRQDVDTRPLLMFTRARDLMVTIIDRLMQVAPVDVVIVPGNHDRHRTLELGVVLDAWYNRTDRVRVDAGPTLRKYVRYGTNLLGFTHGSEEKEADLALIMAQERPHDWAETTHREWHLGHLHKRKQTRLVAGDTHGGVVVRILPALTATDAWHYSQGYVKGPRAAEAYLWHRETGYAGHFSANVLPPLRARVAA